MERKWRVSLYFRRFLTPLPFGHGGPINIFTWPEAQTVRWMRDVNFKTLPHRSSLARYQRCTGNVESSIATTTTIAAVDDDAISHFVEKLFIAICCCQSPTNLSTWSGCLAIHWLYDLTRLLGFLHKCSTVVSRGHFQKVFIMYKSMI